MEDSSMQLLLDAGTFYEFVPAGQADEEFPEAVPVWKVEEGETYALVITACNGLWRYPLGDTVTVKSVDPLKIVIAGRTKHYINAFGEELMVHNADAAITRACGLTGARGWPTTRPRLYIRPAVHVDTTNGLSSSRRCRKEA